MPRFKVHYTADVWETVIVEADTKEHAQKLFETHDDKYFGVAVDNIVLVLLPKVSPELPQS